MTDFNVYCDESRHTSDPSQPFLVIGAVQCPRERKREIVGRIHLLQSRHEAQGELGWKRVAPNRLAFYEALLDLFASDPDLRFRCLVANRNDLDHATYNDGDSELGFYKLYYQMLVHWLQPGNRYHIYLDWQQNAVQNRFNDLKLVLSRKLSGRASIACLEPVTSSNLPLIGLADILIGAVGYAWNGLSGSEAKLRICEKLRESAGIQSLATTTPLTAHKINIFRFGGRTHG
jgi:hypothetical protein